MSAGEGVTFQDSDPSTPPNNTIVSADLISGAYFQRVKVTWGVDGTANDASAATPLPVDGSGVTQPVSGTVTANQGGTWNINNISGTISLPTGAATQTTLASLLAVFPATLDTNSGNKSASTVRVVLATDQPALTNKLLVTPDANSAVNISQMNGVATTMGNGVSGTGVQRVTIASDSTGQIALASGANTVGKTSIAYQTTKALTHASVSFSSSGDNTVVAGTAAQTVRIFKLVLVVASGVNVTIKDGSGTSLTGVIPLAANGSLTVESEDGEPEFITSSGNGFVVNLSAAVTVTGWVQYTKS